MAAGLSGVKRWAQSFFAALGELAWACAGTVHTHAVTGKHYVCDVISALTSDVQGQNDAF